MNQDCRCATCYTKNERYFGWKLPLVCDTSGLPTHFLLRPARVHYTAAVDDLVCKLPLGAILLGDYSYVGERLRHHLDARYGITIIAVYRTNMQTNIPS